MVLESLFGDTLLKPDATEVQTSELSTSSGGVVGIYFSAHWCPPCRGFTPKLASVYKEIKAQGKDFEIVFVSWDNDDEAFTAYHKEMPWLAIPFTNSAQKEACSEKYQVGGIPTLVLLEADTGETIRPDGRNPISEYGAAGFPFTKERLVKAKEELLEAKEKALKELADLSFLGALGTIDEPDTELDLDSVARGSEALAFAFMKGADCQGSTLVLPKLLDIQNKLGKEKLSVIVVPTMEDGSEDFPPETLEKLKGVAMIPKGERAQEVAKKFQPVLQEIDEPHVFIIDARDISAMKIHVENAARSIYFKGEVAFPWSEEAMEALEAREKKLKEETKAKMKDLEFFTPSDECHVVDKGGEAVSLSTLQSCDVVGIYFSAHWCGPCRSFTPKLVEVYNACKENNKSFEVVFMSSDRNQETFDEYYAEMPWCTLKFEDRALKEALSSAFDVEGIPTLILLNGKGEIIADDSTSGSIVNMGADYFPWDEESRARGDAEAVEREARKAAQLKEEEEKSYADQEAAGKIAIKRRVGEITELKIGVDHTIDFSSFATAAAPGAVVGSGKKGWYEITFVSGMGISQVGWATSDFHTSDSYSTDGVGDCTNSYGFDGQRQCKWHDGSTSWGKEFQPNGGKVLGVAADMENGKILFGLDGDWGEPMGVAFEGLDTNLNLFPAITCQSMKVSVNFGDRDMTFGPPDESFVTLANLS